tara:strand:- start:354 stop:680 length:327 start_codon:yes stop_codon:yes gene_type:complete
LEVEVDKTRVEEDEDEDEEDDDSVIALDDFVGDNVVDDGERVELSHTIPKRRSGEDFDGRGCLVLRLLFLSSISAEMVEDDKDVAVTDDGDRWWLVSDCIVVVDDDDD